MSTALHQLRDELAARLQRTRRRNAFGATVNELERTVDAAERAIIARLIGDESTVAGALDAVSPWLRSALWHAAKAEQAPGFELARAA